MSLSSIKKYIKSAIFDPVTGYIASVGSTGELKTTIYDSVTGFFASIGSVGELKTTLYDAVSGYFASVGSVGELKTTVYDSVSGFFASIGSFGEVSTSITDPVTGTQVNVETNGGLAVNIQDQHSRALDLFFIQVQGAPTTLTADVSAGDTTISITSTVGFVNGNKILIVNPNGDFYEGTQIGAPAGQVITLDTPLDRDFSTVNTSVFTAISNMAVDGSITTQAFRIGPVGGATGIEVDITRLLGYVEDTVAMDDAKFGGITALTYGVVLRHNNTVINNLWNVKTNGEFGLLCFDTTYTTKAPAGSFGFRFRNTYAGQSKHGVTIRLEPGDVLEILIQDDLTGLVKFNMMAQGHLVTD